MDSRQERIVSNLGLVYTAANRLRFLPLDYDDLVAEGTAGLIQAVDRFNDEAGVKFSVFARIRIEGAIRDAARRWDYLPRGARAKATEEQPARHDSVECLLDIGWEPEDELAVDPAVAAEIADWRQRLSKALLKLSERERQVVRMHFEFDYSLREIGRAMKITEGRAWQIERQALNHLKEMLSV